MMNGLDGPWMGRWVPLWAALVVPTACNDDSASVGGASSESSGNGSADSSSSGDASTSSSEVGTSPDTSSEGGSSEESTGDPAPAEPEPMGEGIAAGSGFTCSVRDGALTCWGEGGCGQLGDGAAVSEAPVQVADDRTWESVATGEAHACAIDSDRGLWCWGDGISGQVGDGQVLDDFPVSLHCRTEPMPIAEGQTWARISAGARHTCGVQTDGTLWCWGSNDHGQIGDGAVGGQYQRLVPTEVGGDFWLDVFAGQSHTCGLRSDHVVACWGSGEQLGVEGMSFSSTPIALELSAPIRALAGGGAANHSCAIDVDDRLWCWGGNQFGQLGEGEPTVPTPTLVAGVDAVAEAATYRNTTCVRRSDGAVICFGLGSSGQLGDGMTGQLHASATPIEVAPGTAFGSVAVGGEHACARRDDGVDLCWGSNATGAIGDGTSGPDNARLQPTPALPWGGGPIATGWSSIALGERHGCGIRNDGELSCWGARWFGALGNGDPAEECNLPNSDECAVTTPVPSAAGTWHAPSLGSDFGCALRDDDTLWCWGSNDAGQLGDDAELSAVPLQIENDADWVTVDARASTVCGIRSPGTLWCWGSDLFGQLGQGVVGNDASTPLQVGSEIDWIDVEVGSYGHVCGLRAGGELSCWGRNDYEQLGVDSDGEPVATPTVVAGSWSTIGVGPLGTCAVADAGTMWCWGGATRTAAPEQLGDDADWASVTLLASTGCGLRTDATAWCWGGNGHGQLGNGEVDPEDLVHPPTQVSGVDELQALDAGDSTFCALGSDGIAWCWGTNMYGEQGNDTIFTSGIPREVRDDG
jgi:alpha-tubulin suppressor-like RCC1 family protein